VFWGQKHPVSDEQLSAYADGRVASGERAQVDAHLESCAPCREALTELRALHQALSVMPKAARPRSFALREADVQAPSRAAGGPLAAAMPMLSGVTMAAFVAFAVLVGVDVSGDGSSGDRSASSAGFLSAGEDRSPAPQALEQPEEASDDATRGAGSDATAEGSPASGQTYVVTATAKAATYSYNSIGDAFSPTLAPSATPPQPEAASQADEDGGGALRAAQIATAALGLVAGGSLAMVWWRRRT
jgi:anti-sigma factor RsiW